MLLNKNVMNNFHIQFVSNLDNSYFYLHVKLLKKYFIYDFYFMLKFELFVLLKHSAIHQDELRTLHDFLL